MLNEENRLIKTIIDKESGVTWDVNQQFWNFSPSTLSGVNIFMPKNSGYELHMKLVSHNVNIGPVVTHSKAIYIRQGGGEIIVEITLGSNGDFQLSI